MKDNPNALSPGRGEPSSDREEAIFNGALQLRPEQRAEYLRLTCGDDVQLRQRVEALLQAHEKAGAFLEPAPAPAPEKTVVISMLLTEKPGDRIDRYKLLSKSAKAVAAWSTCRAGRTRSAPRRPQVIKLGMDTKSVIARFEAERQALALMDHPNIAKVLDAGATETGRPFFVMELVRGIKSPSIATRINFHRRTAQFVRSSLPRHPARPPKRNHSPRYQAVQHPHHVARWRADAQGH